MKEEKENPLNLIFKRNRKGKITEIKDIQKIEDLFLYFKNDKINNNQKIIVLEELIEKFKVNRYIIEYFSTYEKKSIYLFLFDFYLKSNTDEKLKATIIKLLNELILNIETGKEIYEYLFQKLSKLYRGEEDLKPNILTNYLSLLYAILNKTNKCVKPRNYFSCNGTGHFILDANCQFNVGYSFTIILNFRISNISEDESNRISNLISLSFSNNTSITVDLKYPNFLIVNEIKDDYIKELPIEEWINLIVIFDATSGELKMRVNVNGENDNYNHKINQTNPIKQTDTILKIEFFYNFIGEVGSMTMITQKENGKPGVTNKDFLIKFNQFKYGLYNKKSIDKFINILNSFNSVEEEEIIEKVVKPSMVKKNSKNEEKKVTLFDNVLFIFTSLNCYDKHSIEDYFGRYQLIFSRDIKNHRYQFYQKKLIWFAIYQIFSP